MTKQEFLERLNQLLCDIPKTDRDEAILYYEEYFDEANIGDVDNVLERIDTPEKIAQAIREGLQENQNGGEYTERGYYEDGMKVENELMRNGELSNERVNQEKNDTDGYFKKKSKKFKEKVSLDKTTIILICVILVLTFPLWGGIAGGLLGIIAGIIGAIAGLLTGIAGAVIGVLAGVFALTFKFLIKGVVLIVTGILELTVVPTLGITSIGVGLVSFGIGMLCLMLMVWIWSTVLPACVHGIKWVYKKITRKAE